MEIIITILTICILTIAVILFVDRLVLKSRLINRLRREKKIDKTDNIVTGIKKISILQCACYYEDILIKEQNNSVIFIVKCIIHAGIDLHQFCKDDVVIHGDRIVISIPHSKILDVIANPSDIDPFEGNVSNTDSIRIVKEAKSRVTENAISESNLLQRSNEIAEKNMKTWFKTFGFKEVEVKFKT